MALSVPINSKRLLADLNRLREFGATGNGVVRTTYSDADMASRRWLVDRMSDAGLDARIDGVGNVYGQSTKSGPAALLGSHSDTQPTGGWLDGALGVVYGLEVARALAEHAGTDQLAVDVISLADEESSYLGMIGSRSFCDRLPESEIELATGKDGRRLTEVLREVDLYTLTREKYQAQRHMAFFEAHIEQGPYLEAGGKCIGVVESIVGMRDIDILFCGQQNHAGTTPMSLRRDAGMALIHFASELADSFASAAGDKTVWTIGEVEFAPGSRSIIPGKARMHWQCRDPDETRIRSLQDLLGRKVKQFNRDNHVSAELIVTDDSARATAMDQRLKQHLVCAAERHCPGKWILMPSGAAHDAQIMASRMPAAMLFIPSINGISHSFEENSHEHDIITGCQVMADAVASFLTKS